MATDSKESDFISRDRAAAVFRDFDADGNGTINKAELRDLAYSLGQVLSDEDLEKAFTLLDTDGSGSIDFDEFYTWLSTAETSGDGVSGVIRAKLLFNHLSRQTSKFITSAKALVSSSPPASSSSHNRFHTRFAAGTVPEPAATGLHLSLDTDSSPFSDLSPPPGARSCVFITVTAKPSTPDVAIAALVKEINTLYTEHLAEMMKASPKFVEFVAEGPMALEGVSDNIIMFKFFFSSDPFAEALGALSGSTNPMDCLKYAAFMLSFNKSILELISGSVSPAELAFAAEFCVDVDRHALKVSAEALRQSAAVNNSEIAERLMTDLAGKVDAFRLLREWTLKVEADSVDELLDIISSQRLPTGESLAAPAMMVRNGMQSSDNKTIIASGVADALAGVPPPMKKAVDSLVDMLESIDRVAFKADTTILSMDFVGLDLSWLSDEIASLGHH